MSMDIVQKDFSLPQLERMAAAIAKSGMFAVKTPEGALTLFLIAQAEGISPVQAMMDYDLIQGRPCLKSAAMLGRFQRSGGKVQWIERTNDRVSAHFTHPHGEITVTWDNDRVKLAGLAGKENHKLFPLQMKAARCISEAVRAIAPQSIPLGLYTVEETRDMDTVIEPAQGAMEAAVAQAAASVEKEAMSEDEYDSLVLGMDVRTMNQLKHAYQTAWRRSEEYSDEAKRKEQFKGTYESMKAGIESGVIE